MVLARDVDANNESEVYDTGTDQATQSGAVAALMARLEKDVVPEMTKAPPETWSNLNITKTASPQVI